MSETLDELLKSQTDKRLLRLFAVGCCRQIWDLIKDQKIRTAVEVAERFADGQSTRKELKKAYEVTYIAAYGAANEGVYEVSRYVALAASYVISKTASYISTTASEAAYWAVNAAAYDATYDVAHTAVYDVVLDAAREKQLKLYHCIFTKIVFTTTSQNALNLAKLIYLERQWHLMPILGDALEEAGTINEAVSHCKETEHARGCWVVDNLLRHRK